MKKLPDGYITLEMVNKMLTACRMNGLNYNTLVLGRDQIEYSKGLCSGHTLQGLDCWKDFNLKVRQVVDKDFIGFTNE